MAHAHETEALHSPHSAHAGARPLIAFDDFCFAYEREPALRHITLEIDEGDSVVLMGDNGSGKSTLLKAICGLVHPQQGSYRFDGAEVTEQSMRDETFSKRLHARVGFVFQDSDAQLFCPSVADEIAFGGLKINIPARTVEVDGVKVEMTPKEYDLLFYLVENKNLALSRDTLLQDIWGYDFFGEDRTIDTHIKNLRNNLGPYRDHIVTVRGVGYKFEE